MDDNDYFSANVTLVDGKPVITWSPDLNADGKMRRVYTIWGKTNLTDAAWHTPTNSASRFFKVTVDMP